MTCSTTSQFPTIISYTTFYVILVVRIVWNNRATFVLSEESFLNVLSLNLPW